MYLFVVIILSIEALDQISFWWSLKHPWKQTINTEQKIYIFTERGGGSVAPPYLLACTCVDVCCLVTWKHEWLTLRPKRQTCSTICNIYKSILKISCFLKNSKSRIFFHSCSVFSDCQRDIIYSAHQSIFCTTCSPYGHRWADFFKEVRCTMDWSPDNHRAHIEKQLFTIASVLLWTI